MTPEEAKLFDNAPDAAKKLFRDAKAMQRDKRRAEFKNALLKQAQTQSIPAAPAIRKP